MSKLDPKEVDMLKHKLELRGWYSGIPFDIRPMPERLSRQDVELRIGRLADKLNKIDEPRSTDTPRRRSAMKDRINSWLAQFRDDAIISCALAALERMRVLGRDDTQAGLAAFVKAHPSFKGATICLLGELKDSGAIQAYLSRDMESMFPADMTLEKVMARGGTDPIVLLDDFTGSGSQVLDILGNWFDDEGLKQGQLKEIRQTFGESQLASLRSRPVAFVFVAGWNAGLNRIRDGTEKLGLNASVFAYLMDGDIPFAFEGALSDQDPDALKAFENRCREIGEALLASNGKGAEKPASAHSATATAPCFLPRGSMYRRRRLPASGWMESTDGVDWHALIRRRAKF